MLKDPQFLVFNPGYSYLELLLSKNLEIIEEIRITNKDIKDIFKIIDEIFNKNNITINNIDFISCNLGPAPFTTLRTVISIINAIVYSLNLKTLAINGIQLFIETIDKDKSTVAILNAFTNDVYYAFYNKEKNNQLEIGFLNIDILLDKISKIFNGNKISFIGNGVKIYKNKIEDKFNKNLFIYEDIEYLKIKDIYLKSLEIYKTDNKEIKKQLLKPIYIK